MNRPVQVDIQAKRRGDFPQVGYFTVSLVTGLLMEVTDMLNVPDLDKVKVFLNDDQIDQDDWHTTKVDSVDHVVIHIQL